MEPPVGKLRWKAAGASAFLLLAGLLFYAGWLRNGTEGQQPISPVPRVEKKNGHRLVVLAPSTLSQTGIQAMALAGAVPLSAKVWLGGKSWVYVEEKTGEFRREEASRAKPGDLVVVKGAQMLLSEEFRQALPAGGDDDDD